MSALNMKILADLLEVQSQSFLDRLRLTCRSSLASQIESLICETNIVHAHTDHKGL